MLTSIYLVDGALQLYGTSGDDRVEVIKFEDDSGNELIRVTDLVSDNVRDFDRFVDSLEDSMPSSNRKISCNPTSVWRNLLG